MTRLVQRIHVAWVGPPITRRSNAVGFDIRTRACLDYLDLVGAGRCRARSGHTPTRGPGVEDQHGTTMGGELPRIDGSRGLE